MSTDGLELVERSQDGATAAFAPIHMTLQKVSGAAGGECCSLEEIATLTTGDVRAVLSVLGPGVNPLEWISFLICNQLPLSA